MVKKSAQKKPDKDEIERRRREEEAFVLLEEQNRKKELYLQEKKLHYLRCGLLAETHKWIDSLKESIDRLDENSLKEHNWRFYLSCEDIPYVKHPGEIRDYIFKWLYLDLQKELEGHDWCLKIDERSVLTQNKCIKNLTKRNLQLLEHDIGDTYARRIKNVLKILQQLDEALENINNLSSATYKDLLTLKKEIRELLITYLDIYTFRILSNVERDMERIDQVTAEYIFQSEIFSKYIWTLRDLPLPKKKHNTKINLVSINTNATIPLEISLEKSSFRGIWLSYDHYSDYAPSYKLNKINFENESLREAVINEWNVREKLNLNHVTRMKQERSEWESLKKIEEAAQLAREQGKGKNDVVKPKKSKRSKKGKKEVRAEPPIVDNNTFVDVDEEYCALEYTDYKNMLSSIGPESIPLKPNDINLRQLNIYGGIYIFHYIEQPKQSLQFVNNLIYRPKTLPDVLQYKKYNADYKYPDFPENADSNMINEEADKDNISKLVKIKIKLPEHVCWWEVPVVCRWEKWEESDEFRSLSPKLQNYNLRYHDIMKEKYSRLFNSTYINKVRKKINHVFDDFNMEEIPKKIHLQYLIENEILPRLPSDYQFESELLEEEEIMARILKKKMMLQREEEAERLDIRVKAEQARDELFYKISDMENDGNPMSEEEIQREMNKIADMFERQIEKGPMKKKNKSNAEITLKSASNLFPTPTRLPKIIINAMPEKPFVEYRIETSLKLPENDCILFSKLLENLEHLRNKEKPIFNEILLIEPSKIIDNNLVTLDVRESNSKRKSNILIKKVGGKSSAKVSKTEAKLGSIVKIQKKKPKIDNEKEEIVSILEKKEKDKLKLLPHEVGKWTTNNIFYQKYDPITNTVTFRTGVLGIFGLAANLYSNFPYKKWELKPNPDLPMSAIFSIVLKKIRFNIVITTAGYLIVLPPKLKLPIKLPTKPVSLKYLKKILFNCGINIFPERDAACYIDEKEITEKHYQMETHSYKCIGPFCLTHNFISSEWNRFSNYRSALLQVREIIEKCEIGDLETLKITPLNINICTVTETCTDLSIVELEYTLINDKEFIPDLYQYLINKSNEISRRKQEGTKNKLRWNVIQLLLAVRPLSFS